VTKKDDLLGALQRDDKGRRPKPGATALNTTPHRTTFDIDRDLWSEVQQWMTTESARRRRPIHTVVLVRALLELLTDETDRTLTDLVREKLDTMMQ